MAYGRGYDSLRSYPIDESAGDGFEESDCEVRGERYCYDADFSEVERSVVDAHYYGNG